MGATGTASHDTPRRHLKHEDIVDGIEKEVFRQFDNPIMASLVSRIMWEAGELKDSPIDEILTLLIPFQILLLLPGCGGDFADSGCIRRVLEAVEVGAGK